jgi:DNA-binding GntR family transcriptional regulator
VARGTTASDLVADSIRAAILSGQLRPGETLVERRLAVQLGVSKTPVREALIALSTSGLVAVNPNRGVTVRRLTLDDIRKCYEVRLLLEPWAVSRVARLDPLPNLADARLALDEAKPLLSADDRTQLSLANRRFHRAIYSLCDNEVVAEKLDDLQDLTALGAVNLLWEHWPTWRAEYAEHEEILAMVASGQAAAAERLMRRHIEQSVSRIEEARAAG